MKSLTHWLLLTTLSSSLVLSHLVSAEEASNDSDKAAKTEASATEKPEESSKKETADAEAPSTDKDKEAEAKSDNDKTDEQTDSSEETVKEADEAEATTPAKPDLEREKRLADEIVDAILDGEAIQLKDGDHEFLGIYTEADDAKGTVIILHGRGFHPDWMDTIQPLRVGLVEEGWSTLSLQMPVLEKSAKYYDYYPIFPASFPRIDSAIKYLNEQNDKPVMLLAHSCGAHMAMGWVHNKGEAVNEAIDGYLGLGMGATDYKQQMKQPFSLPLLTVPVLDVYGENDYSAVLRMAPERLAMMEKAGNEQSKQISIPKADHYYTDKGEALTQAIGEWLNGLTFKE
ncbi:MAG: DUF3530 family protein [bacterium]